MKADESFPGENPVSVAAIEAKVRKGYSLTPEEYRLLAYGKTLENAFQAQIMATARGLGWLVYHFADSRLALKSGVLVGDNNAKGFPDLVLIREVVLYRELKTLAGRMSPEQREALGALAAAGESVAVWRPSMWDTHIYPALMGQWRRGANGLLYVEKPN